MIYATKAWALGATERSLKTGAQFVLFLLGVGVTAGSLSGEEAQVISAFALDWTAILGAFLGGAFTSLMTSVVAPENVPVPMPGTGKHRAEV